MSNTITPVITSVGLGAVFNAQNTGFEAAVTEIALGDSAWSPDKTAVGLQSEKRRITVSGDRINSSQIHITGVEDGVDLEYWVREVGFYLSDGTLLAIWSDQQHPLAFKANGVDLLLAFDLVLSALPDNSVTVDGSGGFNLPPANEARRGLIRIATELEVQEGLSSDLAVTPRDLASLSRLTLEDFPTMKESTGWQKLPSGLFIQWFTTTLQAGIGSIPLPVAFPEGCFKVFITSFSASPQLVGGNSNGSFGSADNKTSVNLYAGGGPAYVSILAMGY